MAEQRTADTKTAQIQNSTILSQLKAVTARLDADCTSTLCLSDLEPAHTILHPFFDISYSLIARESLELDKAMAYE